MNVATSGDLSDATGTLTAADDFAVNGATVLGDGTGTDNLTVTTNGGNISLTAGAGNFSLSNSTGLNISTSGDLSDATGDLTIADALSQTGAGQVTFSGNVDATNGLDVTTANLTVGGSNFTVAPGVGTQPLRGLLPQTAAPSRWEMLLRMRSTSMAVSLLPTRGTPLATTLMPFN